MTDADDLRRASCPQLLSESGRAAWLAVAGQVELGCLSVRTSIRLPFPLWEEMLENVLGL